MSEDTSQWQPQRLHADKAAAAKVAAVPPPVASPPPNAKIAGKVYFAVRKGRSVESCIFLSWEDCHPQVSGNPKAIYQCFDAWKDAETYLRLPEDSEAQAFGRNVSRLVTGPYWNQVQFPAAHAPSRKKAVAAKALADSTSRPAKKPKLVQPAQPTKKVATPQVLPWTQEPLQQNPPSKQWWTVYFFLVAYKEQNQDLNLDPHKVQEVWKAKKENYFRKFSLFDFWNWCHARVSAYQALEDKDAAAAKDGIKIQRLKDLGLDFHQSIDTLNAHREAAKLIDNNLNTTSQTAVAATAAQPSEGGSGELAWLQQYQQLLKYREQHGDFFIPADTTRPEYLELRRWMQTQRLTYQKMLKGKEPRPQNPSLTKTRIKELQRLGFPFEGNLHSATVKFPPPVGPKAHPKLKSRKPHKKWEALYDKLKTHVEKNGGSLDFEVDPLTTTPEEAATIKELKGWVKEQHTQYALLRDGKYSSMSDEKIRRLTELGIELEYASFDERVQQLKDFCAEYGDHAEVPKDQPGLRKWTNRMKNQLSKIDRGLGGVDIFPSQIHVLRLLPFFNSGASPASRRAEQDRKWNLMYEQMKAYKEQHGDCLISTSNFTDPLVKWVTAQRRYYRTIEQKGSSPHLDARKLQRLHEIGFVFRQKKNYKSFEERILELLDFKAKHGHLRVPTNQSGLGAFVAGCRDQYRLSRQGKKCSLTEEKFDRLRVIGFEFQVGKTPNRITPRRTWEERYQQLIAYKSDYGDTAVPQYFTGYDNLGQWVKNQRDNYRAMRKGKKSPMTAEMALRLNDLGFAWEVVQPAKRPRDHSAVDDYTTEV